MFPPSSPMTGPPVAPPEAPSLSAFSPQGGPPGGAQAGGLVKLFFSVEQTLDTIAAAVPGSSEEIDAIKAQLRGVLVKASQGGSGNPAASGTAY